MGGPFPQLYFSAVGYRPGRHSATTALKSPRQAIRIGVVGMAAAIPRAVSGSRWTIGRWQESYAMCRCITFLAVGFLLLSNVSSQGQEATALQLYGSGVHAYFSLDYSRAHEYLTAAIKAGGSDPRCYYFRGLCYLRLGRPEQAKADFLKGAELERTGSGGYNVGRALERIQGADRATIEQYRVEARLVLLQQSESSRHAREEVDRQSQRRVMAESVPAPAPAPGPPAAPAGATAAPAAAAPATAATPAPFEEPSKPAPAATAAPAPAATAAAPAATPAPTEPPAAAPMAKPAATTSTEPPAAKTAADDPFATPAKTEKAAPKPAADDPFGAAATPKTEKAAPKAAAPAADDPFGARPPRLPKNRPTIRRRALPRSPAPPPPVRRQPPARRVACLALGKALGHAALDGDAGGAAPAAAK